MDINSVVVVGRVVEDIVVKYTKNNFPYAMISIASKFSQKKSDGSYEQNVNFFEIKILGDRLKTLEKWLKRGRQVIVKGQLRQDRWEDKNGQSQSRVSILSEDIQVCFTEQDKENKPVRKNEDDFDDIPF